MGLVGYSDSEASSDEEAKPKTQSKAPVVAKPTIQKVVDSSNPRKIRVNLPEPSRNGTQPDGEDDERPAKRAKVGGGLGGFNAMLPTPKRPAAASGGASKGLGKGVSLKTGAAPGFTREPMTAPEIEESEESEPVKTNDNEGEGSGAFQTATPKAEDVKEPIKKGNPMMFKPLSVARNTKKKKPAASVSSTTAASAASSSQSDSTPQPVAKPPKVSLFSLGTTETPDPSSTEYTGDYTPMVYQTGAGSEVEAADQDAQAHTSSSTTEPAPPGPQSLDSIATDLNLSASARRQLFGRGGRGASAVNVSNFNTDEEWKHNEELRANGETVQHNPVRSIAPGKHSLKQLVSAVSNQRDALEESFATGKANKKAAGSKYGW